MTKDYGHFDAKYIYNITNTVDILISFEYIVI